MKLKKILSLALAIVLTLSILAVARFYIFADESEANDNTTMENAEMPEESGENPAEDSSGPGGTPVYDEDGNLLYDQYTDTAIQPDFSELQLTDRQLALPTEELLELVLSSEMVIGTISLMSSFQQYMVEHFYQSLRTKFNGARELESRSDVVEVLLAKLAYYVENPEAEGWGVLCFLLRQSEYLKRMTPEQLGYVAYARASIDGTYILSEWG